MLNNDSIYSLRSVTDEEIRLMYSDSNIKLQPSLAGRLRGDFGRKGVEFWCTWFPHVEQLQTQHFKDTLQEVVDTLRRDSLLKGLKEMSDYCLRHPEAKINEDSCPSYGFIVETTEYQFYIRCFPYSGDYQFNIYAYSRSSSRVRHRAKGKYT